MSLDHRGRVAGLCGITIGVAADGQALWIGADVPDELAHEITAIVARSPRSSDPAQPPPTLDACVRAVEAALGVRTVRHAGPSYVFQTSAPIETGADIVRSDASRGEGLRGANPGNWGTVEWDELLDGRLGPWAMVVAGGEVVSICHTPLQMTDRAAECGVWTRPDSRGRGYAAATASAWAAQLAPSGRHLFYRTGADNLSSQRVARRLDLRPIGWTWRVAVDADAAGDRVHPLSRQSGRNDAG